MTGTGGPAFARPMLLVYRALGLGDLLTVVPTLRGLRRAFPGHRIVVATPGWLHPVLRLAGCADGAVAALPLEPFAWRRPAPDLVVNLHGCGPQSHTLLKSLGPRRLVAYACPEAGVPDGPVVDDDHHEVDRWARLVERCLGVAVDRADLALFAAPSPRWCGAFVVHPGASDPARRWPPERFAEVARELAARGEVVVTGSSCEAGLVDEVRRAAKLPETAGLAGRLSMVELARLLAGASAIVSGDTGVAHLATAVRAPSVLIFGPTPPARWGPPPDRRHRVLFRDGVAAADLTVDPAEVVAHAVDAASTPAFNRVMYRLDSPWRLVTGLTRGDP